MCVAIIIFNEPKIYLYVFVYIHNYICLCMCVCTLMSTAGFGRGTTKITGKKKESTEN